MSAVLQRMRAWVRRGGRMPAGQWPEGAIAWGDYTVAHYREPLPVSVRVYVGDREVSIVVAGQ